MRSGFDLGEGDPVGLVAESVTREPESDDRVVVRPDRAGVVTDRVVAELLIRERAHTPTAEQLLRCEVACDGARALLRDDPRPQQVAHVRCERIDGLLVPIESDDVVAAALVRPEVAVEPGEHLLGLPLESVGERVVAHDPLGELGGAQLRVVDVSLDLRGGDRQERNAAVMELDAVPRVLPALIAEALGRARCVLDVPILVAVAEAGRPIRVRPKRVANGRERNRHRP